MGNFVGNHPGQLLLPVGHQNHAGMEKDVAPRHREGVHGGVFNDEKPELKRLGPLLGHQLLSQSVDVGGEEGIFDEGNLLLYFQEKFLAYLLFPLDRERLKFIENRLGALGLGQEEAGRQAEDERRSPKTSEKFIHGWMAWTRILGPVTGSVRRQPGTRLQKAARLNRSWEPRPTDLPNHRIPEVPGKRCEPPGYYNPLRPRGLPHRPPPPGA
jgi:hypothetical protein